MFTLRSYENQDDEKAIIGSPRIMKLQGTKNQMIKLTVRPFMVYEQAIPHGNG